MSWMVWSRLRPLRSLTLAAVTLGAAACTFSGGVVEGSGGSSDGASTGSSADPCEGQACSSHGQCAVDPEAPDGARCDCDDGYRPDGLSCEPWDPSGSGSDGLTGAGASTTGTASTGALSSGASTDATGGAPTTGTGGLGTGSTGAPMTGGTMEPTTDPTVDPDPTTNPDPTNDTGEPKKPNGAPCESAEECEGGNCWGLYQGQNFPPETCRPICIPPLVDWGWCYQDDDCCVGSCNENNGYCGF